MLNVAPDPELPPLVIFHPGVLLVGSNTVPAGIISLSLTPVASSDPMFA